MGNERQTARRASTAVEVNKQSFGKDIVDELTVQRVKLNHYPTRKGLTGRPLRVRLAVVDRWAVDSSVFCEADHDAIEPESALRIVTRLRRGGP